jgi:SpoVK/Ycf46/Vps4 family AAA+-type ATPase
VDPTQRGLVIEEGDVESWLSNLGAADSPSQALANASGVRGQKGGRLAMLASLFGLHPIEQAILLTVLAPELDLTYANLYAYVQDDVTKKAATLDLVGALWCRGMEDRLLARRAISSNSTLRRHLLVSVDDSLALTSPLLSRPIQLDPRVASYLLGADDTDPSLASSVRLVKASEVVYPALGSGQMRSLERIARANLPNTDHSDQNPKPKIQNPKSEGGLVVWMRGPEKLGKRAAAEHLAYTLKRPLLVVETTALMAGGNDLRKMIYRALREARLQDALVYWADTDALATGREQAGTELPGELAQALGEFAGCALFDIRSTMPLHVSGGALSIELDFPTPSNELRRSLWEYALNGSTSLAPDVDLTMLTGAFKLTGDQINAAADTARHTAAWRTISSGSTEKPQVTMRDLMSACRAHSNQGLGVLARKVIPVYSWSDLVLPIDRLAQLREMCLHIRYGPKVFEEWGFDRKLARGKGLNVLFAGQPGTGKTMAAEVLASDLGLELYKIDLSGVVSKYIGETEKNLEKIFHEGQTSNAMLFFDEADSLFGKRSEVKDSHDRYANLEISYLLQRMEEYDGIVILATNLRKNMDEAFIRRMHGAIEFPMPEELDRLEIWRRTFPVEAPLADDVDLQFLAKKFKLSGGNIKNIVLEAAFFAADAGTAINMSHLVRALRREHQKIGKLMHESDFGPYVHMLKVGEATA